MFDSFNRHITYLRVSVTDRCNLRCSYCMPAEPEWLPEKEMLTFDEIAEVVSVGARLGIKKIRLTGGEPTVRPNLPELVRKLKNIPGIEEIALTTNGILLEKLAPELKHAGLDRVNISLDTLDPAKYKLLTKGGDIHKVLRGIEAALHFGLTPVKINVVRTSITSENDISDIKNFCLEKGLKVRFIRQMNLEMGDYSVVEGGDGGNCAICNRLRLTATGDLKPCLMSNAAFNIRKYPIEEAYYLTLGAKPLKGMHNTSLKFNQIGG